MRTFDRPCSSETSYLFLLMAPKKKMALLTIPGSKSVPIPTKTQTWTEHPVIKDSFLKRALNDSIEAGPALEFVGCVSTGSVAPLSYHVYRMRVKREKVLMCDIHFESKA